VIALANRCLDSVRRRVQNEQLGHRAADDRSIECDGIARGRGEAERGAGHPAHSLLALRDPPRSGLAYRVKERLRTSIGAGTRRG